MGQISAPTAASLLLTAVDRLTASNAAGGMSPSASHIIALGEDAAKNIPATTSGLIALGEDAATGFAGDGAIVIGQQALDANFATTDDADLIVIGSRALSALVSQANRTYGFIAIGSDIAPTKTTTDFDGSILIGSEIMDNETVNGDASKTVLIGHGILGNATALGGPTLGQSVWIGSEIRRDAIIGNNDGNSVLIGYGVLRRDTAGMNVANAVLIGALIDGASSGTSADLTFDTIIGSSTVISNAGTSAKNSTVSIGYLNQVNGQGHITVGNENSPATGSDNITIGRNNSLGASTADHTIVIGGGHITSTLIDPNYVVIIAPDASHWLLYGSANTGNIVLGNSSLAQKDTALAGTNRLKLCDGTVAGAAPNAGFYFYSNGGEARAVTSAGAEWVLTPAITTVAGLAGVPTAVGQRRVVSNALAPAYGAVVAGGGAVVQSVMWNGANWVCM